MIAYKVVLKTKDPNIYESMFVRNFDPSRVVTYKIGEKTIRQDQQGPFFCCVNPSKAHNVLVGNVAFEDAEILECEIEESTVPWTFFTLMELTNFSFEDLLYVARISPRWDRDEIFAESVLPLKIWKEELF